MNLVLSHIWTPNTQTHNALTSVLEIAPDWLLHSDFPIEAWATVREPHPLGWATMRNYAKKWHGQHTATSIQNQGIKSPVSIHASFCVVNCFIAVSRSCINRIHHKFKIWKWLPASFRHCRQCQLPELVLLSRAITNQTPWHARRWFAKSLAQGFSWSSCDSTLHPHTSFAIGLCCVVTSTSVQRTAKCWAPGQESLRKVKSQGRPRALTMAFDTSSLSTDSNQ